MDSDNLMWRAAMLRSEAVESRPAPGWAAGTSPVDQRRAQVECARILDDAGIRPGDHVVNLGDETALLTLEALRRVGSSGSVSTVTPVVPPIRQARPIPDGGTARWIGTDPSILDIPSASAQVVVGSGVFAYWSPLRGLMTEAARVLQVGGRLSICEPLHAERHMDIGWQGISRSEVHFVHAAVANSIPALRAAHLFSERGIVLSGQLVGLDAGLPRFDSVTTDLRDADSVKAYLLRPVTPGGLSTEAMMRKVIRDQSLISRYEHALFLGAEQSGVRITERVMHLTAVRRVLSP
ncbi:hypothetical protein Ga0074812_14738 [Parafrankia irregularis]|uniref:Methyltransferase domain-containing protein n=1 Tax=Parafrankia irregularis TaxID=795642 RepID=A0A0S4R156_9ACTN|nr:hypothetical protein [Parafrankia sp. CH37]CUU60792.1 hypothetical protein Ga0074812_14738 [Parafrankia irregularis]